MFTDNKSIALNCFICRSLPSAVTGDVDEVNKDENIETADKEMPDKLLAQKTRPRFVRCTGVGLLKCYRSLYYSIIPILTLPVALFLVCE